MKGLSQYAENIATRIFITISTLVRSVAVTSIKTFLVSKVILDWLELMIGGNEHTTRLESYITGYTGESLMMCRNFPRFLSFCTQN